jgi:hypothetical protein
MYRMYRIQIDDRNVIDLIYIYMLYWFKTYELKSIHDQCMTLWFGAAFIGLRIVSQAWDPHFMQFAVFNLTNRSRILVDVLIIPFKVVHSNPVHPKQNADYTPVDPKQSFHISVVLFVPWPSNGRAFLRCPPRVTITPVFCLSDSSGYG